MVILDARGLKCPLPVLKVRRQLEGLNKGDCLEVLTTDPGAPNDLEAFAAVKGHHIIEKNVDEDYNARMIIEKGD